MWNNWFTVNILQNKLDAQNQKTALDEVNKRRMGNQPITGEIAKKSEWAENHEVANKSTLSKIGRQTVKCIIAAYNGSNSNAISDSLSASKIRETSKLKYISINFN